MKLHTLALHPVTTAIALPALLWLTRWLQHLLQSPWGKGLRGEWRVRLLARLWLNRRTYHALHDVTLPTAYGSTQIDHLFVSVYGVFVVETKHLRGLISGDEHAASWSQHLSRKIAFQNPLRQNHGHCLAVQSALQLPAQHVHSVISFVGASRFSHPMPAQVTRGAGFIRYIRRFKQPVFTTAQVGHLLQLIEQQRLPPGLRTRRRHIRQLQARQRAAGSELRPGSPCPRCDGELVRRRRRRQGGTPFLGCSQFPGCRFTQAG